MKPDEQREETKRGEKNEGEGSRTAAREYDKHVEQTVKSGRVEKLAREAEEALEGEEGDDLRAAEEKGKNDVHK